MPGLIEPSGYKPPERKKYPVADKSNPPAIESIPPQHIKCDADYNCDFAKYVVFIGKRTLYFCGHHFQDNAIAFMEHGYEVKKTNYDPKAKSRG